MTNSTKNGGKDMAPARHGSHAAHDTGDRAARATAASDALHDENHQDPKAKPGEQKTALGNQTKFTETINPKNTVPSNEQDLPKNAEGLPINRSVDPPTMPSPAPPNGEPAS